MQEKIKQKNPKFVLRNKLKRFDFETCTCNE